MAAGALRAPEERISTLMLKASTVSTAKIWIWSAATAECAYQDLEFLDAHGLQGEHC